MINVILASKSPIRKTMMEKAKIPFEIIVTNADETPDLSKTFEDQLKDISMRKAKVVFRQTIDKGERIIVAADQKIVFEYLMYGKPKTINEARTLIKLMEGSRNIYSYVGNSIIYANNETIIKTINNCDIARMYMDNITDDELENYLANNQPLTKCGGINIVDADFLHLEDGKMSTAIGMTVEYLQQLLSSL